MRRGRSDESLRSRRRAPHANGVFAVALALVPALAAALASGCATPGSDLHLAPFYTRVHTADAGVEHEALGGLWRHRRRAVDGQLETVTVGPFYGLRKTDEGDWYSNFLVPLGFASKHGTEQRSTLYPLYVWGRFQEDDGSYTWQLAALPALLLESNDVRGTQFAIFPLWAGFDDFVTFDKIIFLVWPLFMYAERSGRVSYHLLWPVVAWTTGGGESSFRIWPLFSRTKWEGRYERYFFLWPIFHYQRNHLGGGGEEPETLWWVWPVVGYKKRGTYRTWNTLWPFFGYAWDPRSEFWALDFPWPFVRFQRGPGITKRSRFWPFFGYLRTDGLESLSFVWPFIQIRHEDRVDSVRDSVWIIPLWQSWDKLDKRTGETSDWRKLFPLFQYEREGEWRRGSFPTLDPFWRNELIDRHYSWIWKLYEWEEEAELRRERAWLGLYRRERGLGEDRRSIAGLWSRRKYRDGGRAVKETSLLFGLLRWRVTEDEGFDMLPAAFPGPGWPAHGMRD